MACPPFFFTGDTRIAAHDRGSLWRLLLDSWQQTRYCIKRAHGAPLRKCLRYDISGPSEGASQRPHAIGFWPALHGCATTVLRRRQVAQNFQVVRNRRRAPPCSCETGKRLSLFLPEFSVDEDHLSLSPLRYSSAHNMRVCATTFQAGPHGPPALLHTAWLPRKRVSSMMQKAQ